MNLRKTLNTGLWSVKSLSIKLLDVKLLSLINLINSIKPRNYKNYKLVNFFNLKIIDLLYKTYTYYNSSMLNFLIFDQMSIMMHIRILRVLNDPKTSIYTKFSYFKNIIWHIVINRSFYFYKILLIKSILIQNLNKIKKYFNILTFNLKWLYVPLLISTLYFYISLFYIQISLTKQISTWYIIMIIFYLLVSNFNSFINKYRYGKFTSAIQRFWKRTGIVFWLIEGFLFLIFFYYFLNSSQEPMYMFDYSNLNQELLIQLKSSYKNMLLLSIAIYFSFILIFALNFFVFYQSIIVLTLISLIIFYTLFIETYQFIYIINLFADKTLVFDDIKQLWTLEVEQNNLRVKQQYFILCLIAKYWHFIFIFISWFFFLIKSVEAGNINFTLLGYNTQNLIILYVLNLMCLVQWFKYVFKKFLELTYCWFHIQYDEKFFINIISEIILIINSSLNINEFIFNTNNLINISNLILFSNELNLWKFI